MAFDLAIMYGFFAGSFILAYLSINSKPSLLPDGKEKHTFFSKTTKSLFLIFSLLLIMTGFGCAVQVISINNADSILAGSITVGSLDGLQNAVNSAYFISITMVVLFFFFLVIDYLVFLLDFTNFIKPKEHWDNN